VSVQDAKKPIGINSITLGVNKTLSNQDFSLLGPDSIR